MSSSSVVFSSVVLKTLSCAAWRWPHPYLMRQACQSPRSCSSKKETAIHQDSCSAVLLVIEPTLHFFFLGLRNLPCSGISCPQVVNVIRLSFFASFPSLVWGRGGGHGCWTAKIAEPGTLSVGVQSLLTFVTHKGGCPDRRVPPLRYSAPAPRLLLELFSVACHTLSCASAYTSTLTTALTWDLLLVHSIPKSEPISCCHVIAGQPAVIVVASYLGLGRRMNVYSYVYKLIRIYTPYIFNRNVWV